jgi:hypothetical protein
MKRCTSYRWFRDLHRSLPDLKNRRENEVSVQPMSFESGRLLARNSLAMTGDERSHA